MRGGRILAGGLGLLLALLVAAPAAGAVPGEFFGLGGFNSPGGQEDGCESGDETCAQEKWDRLYEAGIRTWRVGIHWNRVQKQEPPAEPDWSDVDTTIMRAAKAGIRTVPRIYQAPVCQGDCGDDDPAGEWEPTGCVDCPPIDPVAMGHWRAMVAAAARRYGRCEGDTEPGFDPAVHCTVESFWHMHAGDADVQYLPIKWWQVWEEPNFKFRWRKPAAEGTAAEDRCDTDPEKADWHLQCKESAGEYAVLVRETHDAITSEIDGVPSAKILLGGLPQIHPDSGTVQEDFLRFVYIKGKKGAPAPPTMPWATGWEAAGIKSYVDGVAMHPYAVGKEGVRGSLIRAKNVMKQFGHWNYHGVKTPLWLTEFGFASDSRVVSCNDEEPPVCVPDPEPFVSDPAGERRKLKKTYKMLVNNRTEYHLARAIWFGYHDRFEDHPSGNGWYAYTGLFFSEDCALDFSIADPEERAASAPDCVLDDNGNNGNGVVADHPEGSRAKPAWCGYLERTHNYLFTPAPDEETYAECFDPPAPPPEP